MKNTTKNVWKKIGWFCYTFVPMTAYFVLGTIISGAATVLITVYLTITGGGNIYSYVLDKMMIISIIFAVIGLIVFGLWYYFGFGRPSLKLPAGILNVKNLIVLFLIAFGAQFVVTLITSGIDVLLPNAMDQYIELIELSGLDRISWDVILYAVILGPIAEELIFRGLTFSIARRFTSSFWIANIMQALAFGIMHGNIVQGSYAFCVGLLFGWVYERFHSLYASIWMHIAFNLLGTVAIDRIYGLFPNTWLTLVISAVVGFILCAVGIIAIKDKKSLEEINYDIH